jgi:hypothetical protein
VGSGLSAAQIGLTGSMGGLVAADGSAAVARSPIVGREGLKKQAI